MKTLFTPVLAFCLLLFTAQTHAQDGPTSQEGKFMPADMDEKTTGASDEVPTGWDYLLKGAANFALNNSSHVVGAPHGTTLNFGFMLNANAGHLSDDRIHEWRNALNWQLGFSKTPVIDDIYKNVDGLDFESIYMFHLPSAKWFGFFAAFQLKTVVFPGYAIFGGDKPVIYQDANGAAVDIDGNPLPDGDGDGNPDPVTVAGNTRIDLTESFSPTTLRETLGVFAVPVNKKEIKFDARLGWGFWETFVRDGYTIADGDPVVVKPMIDVVELGPELRLSASGVLKEMVNYGAKALFMYPAYTSEDLGLDGMEKMNMEFEFLAGVKLWEWASIDYIFKAYKLPVIYDGWQVQNSLLLSITFSVVSPPPAPAPEPAPAI